MMFQEELERELEDLKQSELDRELIETGPTPSSLPAVPNTPLPAKTSKNQGLQCIMMHFSFFPFVFSCIHLLSYICTKFHIMEYHY